MNLELNQLRRTASRILASAASLVFPGTLLLDGREHASGFYYDFQFPFVFQKELLTLIEEKMREIIKNNLSINLLEMVPENAASFLRHHKQPKRAEIAVGELATLIEIFQMGEFVDLCPAPYCGSASEIKAFRLYDISFIDEKTVRIWGTAFFNSQELKEHFRGKGQKKHSSHIELGRELDLFSLTKEGLMNGLSPQSDPFRGGSRRDSVSFLSLAVEESPSLRKEFFNWHPQGEKIRHKFLNLWRRWHEEDGFQFLCTPSSIETTQAHLNFTMARSSITFPFKLAEMKQFITTSPIEGLIASQEYTSDRAHIFCTEETLLQNTISSLQFMRKFSKLFPFEVQWVLHPFQGKGQRLDILKEALRVSGIEYLTDEKKKPFSGPEVHLIVRDGIGREWSCSNLRLESLLLERVGFQGELIVRSLFSSLERWIALLLEQMQKQLLPWLEESLHEHMDSVILVREQKKEE